MGVRSPVSKTAVSGALLLDCFTICGKNDRTMYQLGLLFEMEKAYGLAEEEWVIERVDEEAEAGEECRICRIAVRRSIAYGIGCDDEIQMACLLRKRSYVLENQNTLSS